MDVNVERARFFRNDCEENGSMKNVALLMNDDDDDDEEQDEDEDENVDVANDPETDHNKPLLSSARFLDPHHSCPATPPTGIGLAGTLQ